jgi:hypothetical protein
MHPHTPSRPSRPSRRRASRLGPSGAALAAGALLLGPAAAGAQMPGVPVLQNGFVRPGTAVALNYATGDDVDVIGAAGAWTPASARFQLSGGVGALSAGEGTDRQTTGGVRFAFPVRTPWTRDPGSAFGVAAFVGVGGAKLGETNVVHVPVGVGVGYRRRLGETRAVSLFATPFYSWVRRGGDAAGEAAESESNLFRASLGAEVLVTRRIGVALGYELGSNAEEGRPGPTGGVFGVGASFAF